MDKRMADRLARRIERDTPDCSVTGTRRHGPGNYSLDVVNTETGVPFQVSCPEAWQERMRVASYYHYQACATIEDALGY